MPRKRLLIVDDEEHIREIAATSLELTQDWETTTAECAREGLRRMHDWQPDAVLLDVMMPDMDGPTAFEQMSRDPATAHVPVIFLTAKVQTADRQRFLLIGVRGVIAKPFDPLTLGEQVKGILGWE
jgi:two-component system alkaline phosphatase synthesis response regulator PhoP